MILSGKRNPGIIRFNPAFLKDIPISEALHNLPADEQLNYALNGGDDYEICFTLSEKDYLLWQDDYKSGKAPKIYRVGSIKELSDNRISK